MKAVSSGFEAELTKNVLRMAELITLIRTDGFRVYLTNHDTPLVVDGETYRNDISFILSAVRSDSALTSDNTTLEAGIDGDVFKKEDFRNGLWKKAAIEIAEVHFEDLSLGKVVIRRGLFRQTEVRSNNTVRIDIDGLLKVLDFSIGRVYTPACDAELGDKRCRVAIDWSQAHSFLNPYREGDWVYWYDESELDTQAGTNLDFTTDGVLEVGDPITGWTQSTGATFIVATDVVYPSIQTPTVAAIIGSTSSAGAPEEQNVRQDVTLAASDADIDDGKIMFGVFFDVSQRNVLANFGKVRVDFLDANGDIRGSDDTGWFQLDEVDQWRGRAVVQPVPVEARTARIYVYTRRTDGSSAAIAFTNFRLRYWDHTTQDPTQGKIFKCSNARETGSNNFTGNFLFPNGSFEDGAFVSPSTTQDIPNWTKVSGSWGVQNTSALVGGAHGQKFAYTTSSGRLRSDPVLFSDYTRQFKIDTIDDPTKRVFLRVKANFGGTAQAGNPYGIVQWIQRVLFYDENDDLIPGVGLAGSNNGTQEAPFASRTSELYRILAAIPVGARSFAYEFEYTGAGLTPRTHYLEFVAWGIERVLDRTPPPKNESVFGPVAEAGFGEQEFEPAYSPTDDTFNDGNVTWKARVRHVNFDVVASVTDRKSFVATNMAGLAGAFTSTKIKWLSGNNAGLENIIRTFNTGTLAVKMYFSLPFDIQPGDRFMYVAGCQKRFEIDCRAKFDNAVNYRGFPFVPGNTDV